MIKKIFAFTLLLSFFISLTTFAQNAPSPIRLRGVIEQVDAQSITIKERRGEIIKIAMPPNLNITEVYPIKMSDIQENSYLGTATMTSTSGRLEALEVLVFPESMRGTGEGHYAWDLMPGSMMTNASVSQLKTIGSGRELKLDYKGGSQVVYVPESAPIVTFRPGSSALLVSQANAILTVIEKDGQVSLLRITVGKDGFKPPM
jgi:hypothetical protein